ncbi:Nesprin-1 like protein [Argiope bruennichi]|uniref:Nesprin-1 like protein n=1 Tax=Argiope bruennichi TaxID=94029 RepID=A0A8T0G1S4_ARGBR|nr:Nesprin-1 like protein [Argiope bruennichi]
MFPVDIRNKITEKFTQLQTQMDSTTKFAATSFTQVSGWITKSGKIKEELKILNDTLLSQEKELNALQHEKNYNVSDIESLNLQILENCCKCELLCLNQQRFSLNWIGYQVEDHKQFLKWYRILKLKVFRASENAKSMQNSTEMYQLSYELLNQFLNLLENVLSSKLYIEDLDDSRKKNQFLINLMQSLMAILWTVKENYHTSSNLANTSEADEKYQSIVAKAADIMKKGQKKLEDWNLWELQLIKLEELIENSSCWLKEKNQIFSKETSNNKNLQHSYNTLKDLQWNISAFKNDIDLIKKLKATVSSHIEIPSLEKSSTEVIDQFKELQHNIDSELSKVIFSKEWESIKNEINDLQQCLSSTNKQIVRMQKKIKHMGSDDSVLKFLQDMSKIETEILYRENICIWIRDNDSLQEYSKEEFKNLENAVSQWNQIIESCLSLKKIALQKIAHSEKTRIEEKMEFWVKDVEDNFNNISSNCMMNPKEMKNIKHKLISFLKILDIVIDYLSTDKQEDQTEMVTDKGQSFDKNKVELLKMKLKFELEKYETLILQFEEYSRLASEMTYTVDKISDYLNGIKDKMGQMDHRAITKSKEELKEFLKLLGPKIYQDLACFDPKITEIAETENLPNPLAKISIVGSSISPVINELEENLQLWDRYQEAETCLKSFLSQKKHILFICCHKIVSIDHLHDSINTLQTLLEDIKANEERLERFKVIGSEFEIHLNVFSEDSRSYIQNRIESCTKEWIDFQQTTVKLLEDQSFLLKEWNELDSSFQTLSSFLSSSWYEVMYSHPSRSDSSKEFENVMERLNKNRTQLVSLQEIGFKIQSSSLLHPSVKECTKNKLLLLELSLKSLDSATMYGHQSLKNNIQEEDDDRKILESAALFAGSIENELKMDIPSSKQELEVALTATEHPRILKPIEIEEQISLVQKLINEEEMFSSMTEKAKEIAEELGVTVSSIARNNLLKEISNLQETSQQQADLLKKVLKQLKEAHFNFKEFECELVTVKDRLATVFSFVHKMISMPTETLKDKLQETQVELQKVKDIIVKLNELESQLRQLDGSIFCCDYYLQITTQKDIAEALSYLFEQYAAKYSLLSEASEENQKFLEMYKTLLKWNDLTETKISRNYQESPESIEEKLQLYIKNEAEENSKLLQEIIIIGQSLEENKEKSEFISSAISSCSTNVSRTLSLIDSRDQTLQNILAQKKRAILLQEKIDEFLTNTENFLNDPIQFTDVSLKDVDGLIQALETHQNEIQRQNQSIEALTKDTDELVSQPDAFSYTTDRCLFQHSTQKILSKWALIKAIASERYLYLTNVKMSWKNILTLLNGLEEWLDSREKIASEIDYVEKDHPRSVYLEGIKIFESLKHNFQDDINLLHNVNAVYHKTAKEELDVNNCLKNRVLLLNDRWRVLYQKVCDILTVLNNILQLWADYDQLHEHLHLFLTETHIKITELEHNNTFSQSECDSIMNDFVHHENALERYKALANNLKQKSQCSAAEINHQMEEIEKYWAEVYGCLQNYRDSVSKNIKAKKSEDLFQQTASSSFTADDDGISSSADNFETDSILATSSKDSDEVTSSSYQKNLTEGKKITTTRKASEAGHDEAEFIKDLLAALEEAEDRIDSLETVLSEPTPCGTNDSTAPNYARLLAACRSSIDVIQHLNQLFSERPSDKSSKFSEIDIQHRTEDMLNRWEKIEAATLNKEFRALENAKKWKQFSNELQEIEKWLLDTLDSQTSQSIADADFEKFIVFLQRHEELISQISKQKKTIIALNVTGQKFISSSASKDNLAAVDEKLKAVNNHWEKLCSVALEWQNRLQTEFLQSSEFCSTISEMELWLEDSKEKIQSVDLSDECTTPFLHKQHTEIYALKQQLENCSQRIETLLNISGHLFQDKELSISNEGIIEMQSRLHSILTLSQCLLLECTNILTSLSALLTSRMALEERPCYLTSTYSNEDENPNRISRCCGFLLRVARASLPIQAILLLLLGAAILLPKEDEELSCRLSNNFASSLNPMLHYPDGPPPV